MQPCSMNMLLSEKNVAMEQVVTNIVAHVDTVIVWGMKQVYTRTTLKSKDVTNF